MQKTISETTRRRKIQSEYNSAHNITPKAIIKEESHAFQDKYEETLRMDTEKRKRDETRVGLLTTSQLYYDTENEWLFTEDNFEYTDKSNKIIANRLDSNRDFTDLVTGKLTGSINISE